MKLEPLQFNPIFKDRIWGGKKIDTLLLKEIPSEITGESWEISAIENNVSIVSSGNFKGKSLNEIIDLYPEEILGTEVYKKFGKQFPLLFKFLDAQKDLSIQVHPNDELAKKRHNSFGKTEMWYVMQADENAELIIGFKKKSSPEEYLKFLKEDKIVSLLDIKKVSQGDAYFLHTGTIHAIGAGTLIAEIQQTSDITYRIYDFDRVDADGKKRELHTELALEAINYDVVDAKKEYKKEPNDHNKIVDCEYFTTNFIPLQGSVDFYTEKRSFRVLMCVEGTFTISLNDVLYFYTKGETVLIPAAIDHFTINGNASILEIYIS